MPVAPTAPDGDPAGGPTDHPAGDPANAQADVRTDIGDRGSGPTGVGARPVQIRLEGVSLGYGGAPVQQGLSFPIHRGDIFIIMGGSGCGKSTVMRCLTGLLAPLAGRVLIGSESLWEAPVAARTRLMQRNGVMYQSGALWSSMTLRENIALPLQQYSKLGPAQIGEIADYKLALVGLAGFGDYYPAEISGGMRKRVGVARAMALDPDILLFDEPSAGLDPLSGRRLDDLILELRDSLGTTMVVVTHDLDSIFTIGDDAVFLDAQTKTMLTTGNPRWLRDHSEHEIVQTFLRRGEPAARSADELADGPANESADGLEDGLTDE